jgi:hypothetical protein
MDGLVSRRLLRATPAERARLLGLLPVYVTHTDFVNYLANIDVNRPESIHRWCKPLAAFNSLESLWLQVEDWLRS